MKGYMSTSPSFLNHFHFSLFFLRIKQETKLSFFKSIYLEGFYYRLSFCTLLSACRIVPCCFVMFTSFLLIRENE